MNTAVMLARQPGTSGVDRAHAMSIGLWAFIGVASTLFALFLTAYVMRMRSGDDWSPIAMPPQLWLSSVVLLAGSALLQGASAAARAERRDLARVLLQAGGGCALAFIAVQLWAWQSLLDANVMLAGNPAASFFYLLTAMHGLHVLGGLVAWAATMQATVVAEALAQPAGAYAPVADPDATRTAWRIALCARYWHFLLAVWVLLFATLGWLTPEVVAFICGTS